MYDVGVTPVPAVMVAVAFLSPATTVTVGVPGAVAVAVTTEADGPDASEGPFAFVAITVKV